MKKLFESQLNEDEDIFRIFANASNDMIHICDLDGNILFTNPATERLSGYSSNDLLHTPSEKLIHPDHLPMIRRDKKKLLTDGTPLPAREIQLIRKDGSIISVSRAEMLLDFLGKRKYTGVLIRNTTILKTSARALLATNERLQREIENRKLIERKLIEKKAALQEKAHSLEETNVALNVLLKKRENDRASIEERVCANIGELVTPYLERLIRSNLNKHQRDIVSTIHTNIEGITSDFMLKLSSKAFNLSPAEIRVANHIRLGKRTKEVAALLNISVQTVKNHRHRIREKIGIKYKKIGLASHLSSLG
ncbi:MAG: PAS domain S-box protein [Desulfobacterales bacterium]|nr:PAS domain S-box protein [Desulfobacterales bacterium]